MRIKLTIFFILITISPKAFAEISHFKEFTSTNTWVQYAGRLTIDNHDPENGLDEVGVFVNNGNGGEMLVGAAIVGTTMDNYYLVSVFGDDAQTVQKDGAVAGEELIFKVWNSQMNLEQTVGTDQMNIETASGLSLPDIPATFGSTHGEQYGYLNFQLTLESSGTKKIPIPVNTTIGILFWLSILTMVSIYRLRKKFI